MLFRSGYDTNLEDIVNRALFECKCDEMVVVKDIEFFSMCEHHLLPFFGKVQVAYLPKDKVIGLIYVDSPGIRLPFTYDDLTLLTVMANIAAVRIENVRLAEEEKEKEKMSEELRRAADIQSNLLPRTSPQVPGYEFHGFSLPCRSVGGDYYDYLPVPGGKWAVMVEIGRAHV